MIDYSEFESIQPYSDEDAVAALKRVSRHPSIPIISKYLFPELPLDTLSKMLRGVTGVDDFQNTVMTKVVSSIVKLTSDGLSYDGIENIQSIGGKFLAISNHRDIILDPAFTQLVLGMNNIPMTEICVGNNLLSSKLIEDLMRSNRMIKVIRGISSRELYLSSLLLSRYIRANITNGRSSVWIAQREGRTKDGMDSTEQGLLKMFDLSGERGFKDNFLEINILPISISYEYEPCDYRKAREIYLKRRGPYKKKKNEDLHSILTGIRQKKGHVHLSFGKPLSPEEIEAASTCKGNDRYQSIRHAVDARVVSGYKLWRTNYMAHDILNNSSEYSEFYTAGDLMNFKAYVEHKLDKIEKKFERDELREIFLHIYANPINSKKKLLASDRN